MIILISIFTLIYGYGSMQLSNTLIFRYFAKSMEFSEFNTTIFRPILSNFVPAAGESLKQTRMIIIDITMISYRYNSIGCTNWLQVVPYQRSRWKVIYRIGLHWPNEVFFMQLFIPYNLVVLFVGFLLILSAVPQCHWIVPLILCKSYLRVSACNLSWSYCCSVLYTDIYNLATYPCWY